MKHTFEAWAFKLKNGELLIELPYPQKTIGKYYNTVNHYFIFGDKGFAEIFGELLWDKSKMPDIVPVTVTVEEKD